MADKADSVRTFIAINLPKDIKRAISTVIQQLAHIKGRISWVKPEGAHLTLKFLGNISSQQLEQVKQALEISTKDITPFRLQLTKLGLFPNKNRPRVIWWGLEADSQELSQLYCNIEQNLARYGFPREKRRFTPHITLGRIRELLQPVKLIESISTVEPPALSAITITQVALMQSTLTKTGATYKQLASFPFKYK